MPIPAFHAQGTFPNTGAARHLRPHNQSVRNVSIALGLASVIAAAAACQTSGAVGVARDSPSGEPFAVKTTQACLLHNPKLQRNVRYAVGAASSSFVDWVRRYSGLPVVGELNMLAFGRIDNGD